MQQMKLICHTEKLSRVLFKHMYDFFDFIPSCLCSVKLSGQAHAPLPISDQHPVHTSSLECLEWHTELSCELTAAE
jgi:hypothetical protein